jgi:glucose/arabinose dehydrogenase
MMPVMESLPDNPFVDDTSALDEIWAYGLRNPWRNSFDRYTGDFWIADVGQGAREEINFQPAGSEGGENYGWRCYEGNLPYNTARLQRK